MDVRELRELKLTERLIINYLQRFTNLPDSELPTTLKGQITQAYQNFTSTYKTDSTALRYLANEKKISASLISRGASIDSLLNFSNEDKRQSYY